VADNTRLSRTLPAGVAAVLAAFVLRGYAFPHDDHLEVIPALLAKADPTLYRHDFQVQEALQFTPRFYFNLVIYGLTKTGLMVPGAYLSTALLAFAALLGGLYAVGLVVGQTRTAGFLTAFFVVAGQSFTVGMSSLFDPSPTAQAYAMPFAAWGLWACFRGRWVVGYLLFGAAALFQFLVGTLPALMLAPLLLSRGPRGGQVVAALAGFAALAAAVYLPLKLSGSSGTGLLSDAEFVHTYSARIPHHLVPSAWPSGEYVRFIGLIAAGSVALWSAPFLRPDHRVTILVLVASCLALLAVGYIAVEVWPNATLAVLQPARCTPIVQLAVLAAVAGWCAEWHRRGETWRAAVAVTTPLFAWGPWCLLPLLLWPPRAPGELCDDELSPRPLLDFLGRAVVLIVWFAGILAVESLREWVVVAVTTAGLLLALSFPVLVSRLTPLPGSTVAWLAAAGAGLFVAAGLAHTLPEPLARRFDSRIRTWDVPADDATALALRLRQCSDPDAVVLIPPSVLQFRLFSQRAVVVDYKGFPFTDAGMREWRRRMEDVLGGPLTRDLAFELDQRYRSRSGADLAALARAYGAEYVLSRWHHAVPGFAATDRQGPWTLFRSNQPGDLR
jgi:hypothetical protein